MQTDERNGHVATAKRKVDIITLHFLPFKSAKRPVGNSKIKTSKKHNCW